MAKSIKSKGKSSAIKVKANAASESKGGRRDQGKRRVSTREIEIEIEKWWSLEDGENRSQDRGAAALLKRYMEEYSSSSYSTFAVPILECYRQFLTVMTEKEDWHVEILSPSYVVNQMFQLHSEMPEFEQDMILLCGHSVHRSADDNVYDFVMAERELATIEAVQNRFGSEYDFIWNSVPVRFYLCNGTTMATYLRNRMRKMPKTIDEYLEDLDDVEGGGLEFFYKGKKINTNVDTPLTLGLCRCSEAIEVIPDHKLKFIFRDSSTKEEVKYLHDRGDMLYWMLDNYAEKKGVEKKSLVFLCKGRRMFGHEQAREFNLSNYDVIDVVSAKSYKCEHCICCNPKFVVG